MSHATYLTAVANVPRKKYKINSTSVWTGTSF